MKAEEDKHAMTIDVEGIIGFALLTTHFLLIRRKVVMCVIDLLFTQERIAKTFFKLLLNFVNLSFFSRLIHVL